MSSNTRARRPLGGSNNTSSSLTMLGWGASRLIDCISRKLLTWQTGQLCLRCIFLYRQQSRHVAWGDTHPLTWSALLYEFFIHFIAWNVPVLVFWALMTSLNVPSPFFAMSRYFLMGHPLVVLRQEWGSVFDRWNLYRSSGLAKGWHCIYCTPDVLTRSYSKLLSSKLP